MKKQINNFIDKYYYLPWLLNILIFIFYIFWVNLSYLTSSIMDIQSKKSNPFNWTVLPIEEVPEYFSLHISNRKNNFNDLNDNIFIKIPKYSPKTLKKDPLNKTYSKNKIKKIYQQRFVYTVPYMGSYKHNYEENNGSHLAVDIAAPKWTPVRNIAEWIVVKVKYSNYWFWNHIVIKHDKVNLNWKKQSLYSSYSHLNTINTKKWKKISIWKIIWTVWNTWTSGWSHLHFQIDLENAPFHPYWPFTWEDARTAWIPFYEWINKWLWKEKALKYTINPMSFLYNNLRNDSNSIVKSKQEIAFIWNKNILNKKQNNATDIDLSIFNKTIYNYSTQNDVKNVQKIFQKIWFYKWKIDGNYKILEKDIIKYQIQKKVIKNKNSLWAWWFWPKTRTQVKKDFEKNEQKSNDKKENKLKSKEVKIEKNKEIVIDKKEVSSISNIKKIQKKEKKIKKNRKINTNLAIFDKTIYRYSSKNNIKTVQRVFKVLWHYKWLIDWKYSNIEKFILKYQIEKNLIKTSYSKWAWWFWPKTRAQVKKDFEKIVKQRFWR